MFSASLRAGNLISQTGKVVSRAGKIVLHAGKLIFYAGKLISHAGKLISHAGKLNIAVFDSTNDAGMPAIYASSMAIYMILVLIAQNAAIINVFSVMAQA